MYVHPIYIRCVIYFNLKLPCDLLNHFNNTIMIRPPLAFLLVALRLFIKSMGCFERPHLILLTWFGEWLNMNTSMWAWENILKYSIHMDKIFLVYFMTCHRIFFFSKIILQCGKIFCHITWNMGHLRCKWGLGNAWKFSKTMLKQLMW
jgi:hypothetical protein